MIIGFVGRMRQGKSTAASRLVTQHSYEMLKFAGPLKAALRAMGLTDEMIEGHLKEAPLDMLCGKSPRGLMLLLGTDWGRKMVGEDFWVRLWQFKAQGLLDIGQKIVCDDVRFENEARAIKEMGGILVRVTRPGHETNSTHASETELASISADLSIDNDGTIEDLERTVDGLVEWLRDYDFQTMRHVGAITTGAIRA